MSRAHHLIRGGNPDTVAWTVVRRYEDYARETLPSYKYLVGADNEVFELDPNVFPDFEHGTRIIHVAYDLQGWTGPFTAGIWQFFHAALFDPVLPFLIGGKRAKEKDYGSRIIIGNAARLERPDKAQGKIEVAHDDSTKLDLGEQHGSVTFNYWVVRRPVGVNVSSEAAAGYVRADTAVSMTLFGQRQDTESRSWIKNSAKLPFLYKNMIVQIDADRLTPVAKAEIFTSTRERGTKSDIRGLIYQHLAEVLRNDEELKRLNHEEKERLLQKSATASSEKVRRRLAKFIKTKLKDRVKSGAGSTLEGTGGKKKKGRSGGGRGQRDTNDSHLPNFPTTLLFERKNVRLVQGGSAYLQVQVNAKNGYLPAHDDDLMLAWEGVDPGDKVRVKMRSKLLGGKSRWFFEASGDAVPGDYALRATLITPTGLISDSVTVNVAVPPPAKPEKKGNEPETGPQVEWVNRDAWDDHEGVDGRTVGYVSEDTEETIIWVNRHHHLLDQALSSRSLTPEQIDTRASRYQFPVACALWLQHDAASRAAQPPDEKYQKAELERVAEAVLVAIDPDVDAVLEESED